MRKFDYSFLKGNVPGNFISFISQLYSLKTLDDIRKDKYISIYTELEKIAKIQSIKSSNAIEGIITTDERIKAIVNQNSAPLNHNEQEIAGYRDALNLIHLNYSNLSFDEKTIKDLHFLLLSSSKLDSAGKYKTDDNVIMQINIDGSREVRFTPTPAKETSEAMNQLVLAYMEACSDSDINQLLLIPCVILDFLRIHPFSDGNGRMSRLLTLLLLYKNNFSAGKYISFEKQINKSKGMYYEYLKKSSVGWHENTNDYFCFIGYFLLTLLSCYKELDNRFNTVNNKKFNKSSRIEAALLNSLVPISKKEISELLPDVSITTIELVISKLLKEDKIIKIGNSISTKYYRK